MKTIICFFTFLFVSFLYREACAQSNTAKRHADVVSISPDADRNIAIGADYINALVAGDWTKVRSLLAPGFMTYGPGALDSANTEQNAKMWQEQYQTHKNREIKIIASTSMQVKEGSHKGDWLLLWLDYKAQFDTTNKSIHVPVQMTIKMDNGKIAVEQSFFDTGSVYTQLGWTMTPPQTAKK